MNETEQPVEITASSGNVFLDLKLPHPEEELVRADLAAEIKSAMMRRGLTQAAAAALLGIRQPKVSAIVRGRLGGYSIERLMRYLRRTLDPNVQIDVVVSRQAGQDRTTI